MYRKALWQRDKLKNCKFGFTISFGLKKKIDHAIHQQYVLFGNSSTGHWSFTGIQHQGIYMEGGYSPGPLFAGNTLHFN